MCLARRGVDICLVNLLLCRSVVCWLLRYLSTQWGRRVPLSSQLTNFTQSYGYNSFGCSNGFCMFSVLANTMWLTCVLTVTQAWFTMKHYTSQVDVHVCLHICVKNVFGCMYGVYVFRINIVHGLLQSLSPKLAASVGGRWGLCWRKESWYATEETYTLSSVITYKEQRKGFMWYLKFKIRRHLNCPFTYCNSCSYCHLRNPICSLKHSTTSEITAHLLAHVHINKLDLDPSGLCIKQDHVVYIIIYRIYAICSA